MMNPIQFNPRLLELRLCCESSDFGVEVLLTKSSTTDINDGDDGDDGDDNNNDDDNNDNDLPFGCNCRERADTTETEISYSSMGVVNIDDENHPLFGIAPYDEMDV